MNKQELRKRYLAMRKGHPQEQLRTAGEQICARVMALGEVDAAKCIMTYLSFGGEVDTYALVERLCAMQKTVCAPLCNTSDATMEAYQIGGIASLTKGAYGILEPKPEQLILPEEMDCILVPGCAFGRNFHRIGYGKGYYDRFLPRAKNAVKIGLCYDFSLVENLTADPMDIPVDIIVTEKEVLRR